MFRLFRRKTDTLLDEVVATYPLRWVEANLPQFSDSACPNWWQGVWSGTQFAIRPFGDRWVVVVGRVPAIVDVELTRLDDPTRLPNHASRLEGLVPAGHALAQRFCKTLEGVEDPRFTGRQLIEAGVCDDLAELSPAVRQVGLYRHGVELDVDRGRILRRDLIDWDIERAVRVTRRLLAYAAANPVHAAEATHV